MFVGPCYRIDPFAIPLRHLPAHTNGHFRISQISPQDV